MLSGNDSNTRTTSHNKLDLAHLTKKAEVRSQNRTVEEPNKYKIVRGKDSLYQADQMLLADTASETKINP